jgi:uncharacterized protein YndB with AHSA1/START domain
MALESIQVSALIPASPDRIFQAWLSSQEHSAFTGGQATVEPRVGGRHTAWDGYIEGVNLTLEEGRRIVQSWRSSDFPDGSTDSKLEVLLEPTDGGTKVTLVHTDIPEGQGRLYEQGWVDHYFTPMQEYFAEEEEEGNGESDAPTAGNFPPPEAPSPQPAGGEDDWDDDDDGGPTAPGMEAPAPEIEDDEPMDAPAPAAPAKKKAPSKKPAAKKKPPAAKKKPPAAKKKPPAAKKKPPAAKKKPPAAKKKPPAAKKKPAAAAKKKPAKKPAPKKKGRR